MKPSSAVVSTFAVVFLLVSCVGFRSYPRAGDKRTLKEVAAYAERIRGLKFLRPPQVHEVGWPEMMELFRTLPSQRGRSNTLQALGIAAPALTPQGMVKRCAGGMYDERTGDIYLCTSMTDNLRAGSIAERVAMHEFIHALQDQHFDLFHLLADATTDQGHAIRALVAGDAQLTCILPPREPTDRNWHPTRAEIRRIPELAERARAYSVGAIREGNSPIDFIPAMTPHRSLTLWLPIISWYTDGANLVAYLYNRAGWSAVNAALRAPPVSTAQVLHPEQYVTGVQPETVVLPRLATLEGAGYTFVETDTVGQMMFGVYAGDGRWDASQRPVFARWRGDRLDVYKHREGKLAAVWLSAWADDRHAAEAERAAAGAHTRLLQHAQARTMLVRSGRRLLIARGIPQELHAALRSELAKPVRAAPPRQP